MSHTAVLSLFEKYQRARIDFIQGVAELSQKDTFVDLLLNAGVLNLVVPLLKDVVPSIQQTASLAMGRLASQSPTLSNEIISADLLPHINNTLASKNTYTRKAGAFVIRSLARHNADLATKILKSGTLDNLVPLLQDLDPTVKEAGAWSLGYIAQHSPNTAQPICDTEAVAWLVRCLQEPEIFLKRIAASVLGDIAKHNAELAQQVVNNETLKFTNPLLMHQDMGIRRQVCTLLSQIAKHNPSLAQAVVQSGAIDGLIDCLKVENVYVRRNAVTCLREIAKHSLEFSKLIMEKGACEPIVSFIQDTNGLTQLPAIMAVGYISAFNDSLAMNFLVTGVLPFIKKTLCDSPEDFMKAACAWTLGQLGRHSPDHTRYLLDSECVMVLVSVSMCEGISEDLQHKTDHALKVILEKCMTLDSLQPILQEAPVSIKKYVLKQLTVILPKDKEYQKKFVTSGALSYVQELKRDNLELLGDLVEEITALFPPEVISYYDPHYADNLLDLIKDTPPDVVPKSEGDDNQ